LKPRLKFIWGASQVIKGRWYVGLFGFYDREEGVPDSGLALSVRGLLAWSTSLVLAGYLAAASALFLWLDRNPFNRVGFSDTLSAPWRWQKFERLRGQSLIAEGMADLKAERWGEAFFKLRNGIKREPKDLSARLVIAQIYVATGQRPLARSTLRAGLDEVFPGRDYLSSVFTLAALAEDYAEIEELCVRYLGRLLKPEDALTRRWLMERRFSNLLDQGDARRLLTETQKETSLSAPVLHEFRTLAYLALQHRGDAQRELSVWAQNVAADRGPILRLSARVAREDRDFAAMENFLSEAVARSPQEPSPYVYQIIQLTLAGRADRATQALEVFLQRFSANYENLRLLAEPLAAAKGGALIARLVVIARDQGMPTRALELLHVQALLTQGAAAEAQRVLLRIAETEPKRADLPGSLQPILSSVRQQAATEQALRVWLQTLTEAVLSPLPSSQSALLETLRKRPVTMGAVRELVVILRAANKRETALAALRQVETVYPGNVWLKSEVKILASEIALAEAAAARPAVMIAAIDEHPFFEKLNHAIAQKNWAEAQRAVREVRNRRPAPEWLAARDAELWWAQLRIEHGLGDRLAGLITAKVYLDGSEGRAQGVLSLAQELYATGKKDEAVGLVREVLRKTPDFTPAERVLAAWVPPKK
jgi:hypothetical protein